MGTTRKLFQESETVRKAARYLLGRKEKEGTIAFNDVADAIDVKATEIHRMRNPICARVAKGMGVRGTMQRAVLFTVTEYCVETYPDVVLATIFRGKAEDRDREMKRCITSKGGGANKAFGFRWVTSGDEVYRATEAGNLTYTVSREANVYVRVQTAVGTKQLTAREARPMLSLVERVLRPAALRYVEKEVQALSA